MAKTALGGAHTAGIYADLTLDGPEIGTLVVIIDRAKNLPNRKTMGKQDPYCAARLGKEAKKTETDKRGGQTPKWDQELRFTVHDSPDYYQLKVSVFNDDKKTELIGEAWVALEKIVVPGGGTNDLWQGLNCKGRYAGDIRIELTYYDTRPKLGKADTQYAPTMGSTDPVGSGIGGPRQPKPIKRKPYQRPSDRIDPPRSSPTYVRDSYPGMLSTDVGIENMQEMRHTQGLSESQNEGHDQENDWDAEDMDDWQPGRRAQPLSNRMVHSNSSPAMIDFGHQKNMPYAWPETETLIDDEGPAPPPPPAHRSIPVTAPLNTRPRGVNTGSLPGSPLAKVQSNSPFQEYQPSTSPSQSANYLPQSMPPSLIPGYEPKAAKHDSQKMYERRMSERQQSLDQPSPPAKSTFSAARVGQQPLPRNFENTQERRAHRYSAPVDRVSSPVSNPRTVSPDDRPPVRKFVSPQPAPAEKIQQSGIPFSPDSFDAYNPSVSAANSANDVGARYSTPEQAEEVSRQHERQEKLGDGPIIGNDGRIIDPSDHLPTETWAPEPEQKTPTRRGPEVTVRFRNSPQGAQPMPPAGRRPLNEARSQSASTSPYALNSRNSPSSPLGRMRPQQYPRVSPSNVPPPVPGKMPMGGGKEDWDSDALSDEMRRIDIGTGRRRGYGY